MVRQAIIGHAITQTKKRALAQIDESRKNRAAGREVSLLERISVSTRAREELVDITAAVQAAIARAGVKSGLAVVMSQHTTAGVTINENADPDVRRDIVHWLATRIPRNGGFRHSEGNSDAHVKTSLCGVSQAIPIEGGKLALGMWQAIFLAEFDGPRERTVLVKLL
jgi:secondary thiamine-phosphate synthase enzyme